MKHQLIIYKYLCTFPARIVQTSHFLNVVFNLLLYCTCFTFWLNSNSACWRCAMNVLSVNRGMIIRNEQ